ncbi:MAG: terminase, partial [Comamonadaceae bacterium]
MMLAAPTPEQILTTFKGMTAEMRAAVDSFLMLASPAIWVPQAGPQSAAFHSQADILFYGGSAGGGKSELLLGLSLTEQEHSIVFRREAVQLIGLEERMTAILGSRLGYNGQDHLWRLPDKKVLELGSVQKPDDWMKYQGRPHDFKGFDEITHFTELQFRTLIGWMRTDNPNVRQRVVAAGNPPTTAEGEWVKRYWAAWLDPQHPNPAKPGELRWYVTNEKG